MKKFTLLAVVLLFAFVVKAQLFNIGGFGVGYLFVGPKLGGNVSFNSVEESSGATKTANYGYQFGGVAKFGITKKLAIQPELIYTSKGYAEKWAAGSVDNANYKYFGIPVIAKYAFAAIADVQIYGSGGFYTDILTGVEIVNTESDWGEEVTDLSQWNRVDFGFNIGTGANIPFKNRDQLNIDLSVSFGATKTQNFFGNSEGRSTSVQLSAVYLLDLTRWVNFKGQSILNQNATN